MVFPMPVPYSPTPETLRIYVSFSFLFLFRLATRGRKRTKLMGYLRSLGPLRPEYIPDTDDANDGLQRAIPWL